MQKALENVLSSATSANKEIPSELSEIISRVIDAHGDGFKKEERTLVLAWVKENRLPLESENFGLLLKGKLSTPKTLTHENKEVVDARQVFRNAELKAKLVKARKSREEHAVNSTSLELLLVSSRKSEAHFELKIADLEAKLEKAALSSEPSTVSEPDSADL